MNAVVKFWPDARNCSFLKAGVVSSGVVFLSRIADCDMLSSLDTGWISDSVGKPVCRKFYYSSATKELILLAFFETLLETYNLLAFVPSLKSCI
jgi:hypothetical protein